MQRAGLRSTGGEGRLVFATGGSPGAAVVSANLLQIRDEAVGGGLVTAGKLAAALDLLEDPEFTFAMPLLVSAWGRRPTAARQPTAVQQRVLDSTGVVDGPPDAM
jgi:hypothetical protein